MIKQLTAKQLSALALLPALSQGCLAGTAVGRVVGTELAVAVGQSLPVGLGGIAGITALSLIIGVQLVKRKNK